MPVDLRAEFEPVLTKYQRWGQNCFAFLRERAADDAGEVRKSITHYTRAISRAAAYRGGGESARHRRLKEFVAGNPQLVSLPAARRGMQEYGLPSGDCIDVFFGGDDYAVAVEVKSAISPEDDLVRGIFQCVKYRAVLDAVRIANGLGPGARAVLVLEATLPDALVPLAGRLAVEVVEGVRPA